MTRSRIQTILRPFAGALASLASLASCTTRAPAPVPMPPPTPSPASAAVTPPADTAAESRARAAALLERSVVALGGRERILAGDGVDVVYDASSPTGWQQARRPDDS